VLEIWPIDLSLYAGFESTLINLLDASEKERAYRFKFDHHRSNFILSHALLRCLISHYLNLSAKDISFCQGLFGKPFLPNKALHFNMSHSHQMALYAFYSEGEIGADVEYISPTLLAKNLPLAILSQKEQEQIILLPASKQKETFYKIWTRKEAYFKATGFGLQGSFNKQKISPSPSWNFFEVPLSENYEGIIAYETALNSLKPKIRVSINLNILSTDLRTRELSLPCSVALNSLKGLHKLCAARYPF